MTFLKKWTWSLKVILISSKNLEIKFTNKYLISKFVEPGVSCRLESCFMYIFLTYATVYFKYGASINLNYDCMYSSIQNYILLLYWWTFDLLYIIFFNRGCLRLVFVMLSKIQNLIFLQKCWPKSAHFPLITINRTYWGIYLKKNVKDKLLIDLINDTVTHDSTKWK